MAIAPIRLSILGERELAGHPPIDALISISEPGEPRPPLPEAGALLTLDFYDLRQPEPGLRGPTHADARALRAFARQHIRPGMHVLVHCAAGISRSPAAALAPLLSLRLTPEQAIAEVLRVTRDLALPNPLLVRYLDATYRLHGRLERAVTRALDDAEQRLASA